MLDLWPHELSVVVVSCKDVFGAYCLYGNDQEITKKQRAGKYSGNREQSLKDKRCQASPHTLLVGGLSCSLGVTSVPLGSAVPTHPMAPVSCTGYDCRTGSHTIWPEKQLPLSVIVYNPYIPSTDAVPATQHVLHFIENTEFA